MRPWLIVGEHGWVVYLDRSVVNDGVRTHRRVSKRTHLHRPAPGRAILAHLSDNGIQDIVDSYGLPSRTERTITDKEVLLEELAKVRQRGYAVSE